MLRAYRLGFGLGLALFFDVFYDLVQARQKID